MKHLSVALWSLLCVIVLGACGSGEVCSMEEFSQVRYAPAYASGFDIRGAEGVASAIITARNPWQGAEDVEQQLLIARNGEKAPKGFVGQVLNGEARRVVCMSSTYVAMIDALDCVDRVVGVSGIDYIYNDHVQAAAEKGRVRDVGHDSDVNFELLLSLHRRRRQEGRYLCSRRQRSAHHRLQRQPRDPDQGRQHHLRCFLHHQLPGSHG